jgi:LuxR family maltose regulon positive regulatory protein
VGGSLERIHGGRRAIADYLTGEVLERQPHRTQEFLLRTSILERLSAPLCRAVTGMTDAHVALKRLARDNLFVIPLDDQETWYRYHHLFAECLRAQLERQHPDELPALHREAAEWHHDHGDPEQAVRHWLTAGDVEPAADLATSLCEPLLNQGQAETMRRIMAMFSDSQVLSHAGLTLSAGWVYGMGNPHYVTRPDRKKLVHAACARTFTAESAADTRLLRSSQAFLRAFLAPDGVTRMLADAELSLDAASVDPDSDWYADSCKLRGIALYLDGQPAKAAVLLRHYAKAAPDPADARPASEALAFESLILGDQGRWDEAAELADRASRCAALAQNEVEPPLATLLARTRVLARRDDPALGEHVQRVTRFLDEMPNLFEREKILGAVFMGEIALGDSDVAAAERWSARAQAELREYPDAGMLRARAEHLRLALQERRLGLAVTAAEQRVLDLLPTELSVDEIGARLFISRNTMRSHLRSLYTKLEVHSRAEAIRRARALGLLRPSF